MTVATIRAQIVTEIGERTDFNDEIDDQINYAYDEIATTLEIKELQANTTQTTTDGTAEYALTSTYAIFSVSNQTNFKVLEESTMRDYDARDNTETGAPNKWAREANNLYVFAAVPDDNDGDNYTLLIRYWLRPDELTTDASNHIFPRELERGIRLLAGANTMLLLNDDQRYQVRIMEYQRWLQRYQTPRTAENINAHKARIRFHNPYRPKSRLGGR
jgi:hypothetical protein